MAIIHDTTMSPGKLELLTAWLPAQPWYRGSRRAPELTKCGGFRLDDPDGEVGIEFMLVTDGSGERAATYQVPMTYRASAFDGAGGGLIGMSEHGVLGGRWIYDGTRDPVLVSRLVALIQGEAEPQAQSVSHTPDPTVISQPVTDGSLTVAGPAAQPAGRPAPTCGYRQPARTAREPASSSCGSTGPSGLAMPPRPAKPGSRACPPPGANPTAPRSAAS